MMGVITRLGPKVALRLRPWNSQLKCIFAYKHVNNPRLYSQAKGGSPKDTIIKLLENIKSQQDAQKYLEHFNDSSENKFAIIKVGGAVLTDYLDTLASSLKFLQEAGLYPIVVHGAGPQLNKLLAEANIEPQYHEGIRITDASTLEIVRSVFQQENLKLVEALEKQGARAQSINGGVFIAEHLNKEQYGFVGQIVDINRKAIDSCIATGALPILTSIAETKDGQILNVNADVAASILARTIQPLKVVYLNEKDGIMHGETGKKMDVIDLTHDYAELSRQPWFRYGTKLKINQIKELIEGLPQSSSVSVISPAHLTRELLTYSGGGTLIRRGINIYTRQPTNNEQALVTLINNKARIDATSYLKSLPSEAKIYHDEGYTMAGILSLLPNLNNIPFLTCLVGSNLEHLWDSIHRDNPKLIWVSDKETDFPEWHLTRSEGSFKFGSNIVLWYGLTREEAASLIVQFDDSHLAPTKSVQSTLAQRTNVRSYSTSASPQLRVGLIGARGHTGQELVQLVNNHPSMRLAHISSRELNGEVLESYTKERIRYELIPADVIGQINDVDAWILALPNGVAKSYVEALDKEPGPVILDLSADYRFDDSKRWWYGLPELYPFSGKALPSKPAVTRISNPGCYATGCQVGLKPLIDVTVGKGLQLPGRPTIFGVSGFSGAGTTPSPKNDPEVLRDNMIPYSLTGHIHEREAGRHLKTPIYFSPHVASFFRGITLTISVPLPPGVNFTTQSLLDLYSSTYSQHELIHVQEEVPLVKDNQNHHGVRIGGFTMAKDGSRAVLVATLDNLLKGAATQAIQNLNLAFGLPGRTGIPPFK